METNYEDLNFKQIEEITFGARYNKNINVIGCIEKWEMKKNKSNGKSYMQGILISPIGSRIMVNAWNYQNKEVFKIKKNSVVLLVNVIPKPLGDNKYLHFWRKSFVLTGFNNKIQNIILNKCNTFKKIDKWINKKQNCMFVCYCIYIYFFLYILLHFLFFSCFVCI